MSSVQSPMAYRKMLTRSFSDLCASHEAIWDLSNLWHHFFPVGSLAVKGLQQRKTAGLVANGVFASLLLVIVSWHHLGFARVPLPPFSVVC